MVKNQLVWTRRSQQHLKALYNYINETSLPNCLPLPEKYDTGSSGYAYQDGA